VNFVPTSPVESVLAEVLAAVAQPAWIVDADRGLLVASNGRGDAVWGVPVMTLALDNASIPALKALRERLSSLTPAPSERSSAKAVINQALRFKTFSGDRTVPCAVRLLDDSVGRGLLLVVAEGGPQPIAAGAEREAAFDERAFVERWLSRASDRPSVSAAAKTPPAVPVRSGVPLSDADTLREIARRIRQGANGLPSQDNMADEPSEAERDAAAPSQPRSEPMMKKDAPALDVSAHLAHEIRTPLAAIISLAEVITEERLGPWPNERYRAYVRDILDSARHGLEVVDGILREAPGDATPVPLRADLDLNAEVEALCASLRPLAEKSGARLEPALVSGLPRVAAERRNVRQMLLNLISNALKHGGKAVRIKVTTGYELGGEVWVEVEDNGPGMASPRDGGKSGSRAARKAGLGLPLTRSLATANQARLDVSSRPGRGVRARIVFGGTGVAAPGD
jgi:signal transduction histidine kinase